MVRPHIKLSDHMTKRFIVIVKNAVISFKHEYRRPNSTSRCDVTDDVISVENTFSEIMCNDFFISDDKMNQLKHFEMFKMASILRSEQPFKL